MSLKYKIGITGTTPLLMHKFIGMDVSKTAKEKPDTDHAEMYTYRNRDGELSIPIGNMRAAIVEGFVGSAGAKQKTKTKMEVSPRIKVESIDRDPLYISIGADDYTIDKRSVSSGGKTRGVRDWCVRPMISEWEAVFILNTNVDIPETELRYKLDFAGSDVGVLSNRPNGFGRFKVETFEKT